MASKQPAPPDERQQADLAKAHELAEQYPGWHVFSSQDGGNRIATRTGNQKSCPVHDGCDWSATVIGDSWPELEQQLKEQSQHDAERTYEVVEA